MPFFVIISINKNTNLTYIHSMRHIIKSGRMGSCNCGTRKKAECGYNDPEKFYPTTSDTE